MRSAAAVCRAGPLRTALRTDDCSSGSRASRDDEPRRVGGWEYFVSKLEQFTRKNIIPSQKLRVSQNGNFAKFWSQRAQFWGKPLLAKRKTKRSRFSAESPRNSRIFDERLKFQEIHTENRLRSEISA